MVKSFDLLWAPWRKPAVLAAVAAMCGTAPAVGSHAGNGDLREFGVHQLRRLRHAAQPDADLFRRRRGADLQPDCQSAVTGRRAGDDDHRQLQQPAAGQRLRLDRRRLCRVSPGRLQRDRKDPPHDDHLHRQREQRSRDGTAGVDTISW